MTDPTTPPRPAAPHPLTAAPPVDRLAVPGVLAWLRDDAGLRPPAIARVVGVTPIAFAQWTAGVWAPSDVDVPLLGVLAHLHAQVSRRLPDARSRRRWWTEGEPALGWRSPAEVLRRGRMGELFVLLHED